VAASWLIPGAGHWMLGARSRAMVLFVAINGLFWGGQALAGFRAVNRENHPYFFVGQIGNGLSALASQLLWSGPLKDEPASERGRVSRSLPPQLSTGLNFATISGLLNMLLVLHVADPKSWRRGAAPASPADGGRKDA
jgi:hypothetical protein